MTDAAGPSQTRIPLSISGSLPGVIDPSQPDRLLSTPGSKLSFASFHPRTASSHQDPLHPRKLSTREELCSSRRIVIETLPTGESFWRWVPRAKGVDNFEEEGQWPRVIEICGQLVHCSLEQWDIYKLDPNYDCLVQHPPKLTIITPRKHNEFNSSSQSSTQSQSQSQSYSKRQPSPPSSDSEAPRGAPSKKRRGARIPEIDTDDEDEVAEMILDEPPNETKTGGRRERLETMNENRKIRREKITQRKRQNTEDDLLMRDLSLDDIPIPGASSSASPSTTANGDESPTTFSFTKRSWDDDTEERKKRVRTGSPLAAKEHLAAKRTERERMRRMKEQERLRRWKESRDQIFMQNLFHTYTSTANGGHSYSNGFDGYPTGGSFTQSSQSSQSIDEDPISLEEKIRRMAEINAFEHTRSEQEALKRKAEADEAERRRRAEEHQARLQKEQQERIEREKKEQERKRRMFQEERWLHGPWTTQRALERYKSLAEAFDSAKFSADSPICFRDIPWPVLLRPTTYTAQDVDWSAVETFFISVKSHMKSQDYKTFVEKSHRRFHPDRWRARRVLLNIQDDEVRQMLEVAANTVAQALTPLWREVKGG